jgi:hypothetical protein
LDPNGFQTTALGFFIAFRQISDQLVFQVIYTFKDLDSGSFGFGSSGFSRWFTPSGFGSILVFPGFFGFSGSGFYQPLTSTNMQRHIRGKESFR